MTTLALFLPDTLVGMELRKALVEVESSFERVIGVTSDPDDVGNLIEIAGQAVRVEELSDSSLADSDLVISCAETFRANLPLLTALEATGGRRADLILVAPDTPLDAGEAIVPAVNLDLDEVDLPSTVVIAHPGVILLGRMLHALRDLGIESSASTVLQPASVLGQGAMNEVFGQARSLLTMDGSMPTEHFGFQTAFSTTLPRHAGDDDLHRRRLRAILGEDQHDLRVIQAGSFHGVGISSHVRFESPVTESTFEATVSCLSDVWETLDDDPSTVGRAEAELPGWTAERAADGQSAWIWIAADNLAHAVAPTVTAIVSAWGSAPVRN